MELAALAPWAQFGIAGLILGVLVAFGWMVFRFAGDQIVRQVEARERDLERMLAEKAALRQTYIDSIKEARVDFLSALKAQSLDAREALAAQAEFNRKALAEVEGRLTAAIGQVVDRLEQIARRLGDGGHK